MNTGGAKITGFDNVMQNLNSEISKMKKRSMKGLIESAIIIRRDMAVTPPLIPIDKGNLNSSWFTSGFHSLYGPVLLMGFTANYAVFVHENLDPTIEWKKKGSGPKFLEKALVRNHGKIIAAVAGNTTIL